MAVPPTLDTAEMSRSDLRDFLRSRRQSVVNKQLDVQMSPAFQAQLKKAHCIGLYMPMGNEVPTAAIADLGRAFGKMLSLPWFARRDLDMRFRIWTGQNSLTHGPYKFLQPSDFEDEVIPDLLIIPMLGFDRQLNRLGQGMGHYDRYLVKHPDCRRIGLAWSVQEVKALPAQPWDVPMHAILTEAEWIDGAST